MNLCLALSSYKLELPPEMTAIVEHVANTLISEPNSPLAETQFEWGEVGVHFRGSKVMIFVTDYHLESAPPGCIGLAFWNWPLIEWDVTYISISDPDFEGAVLRRFRESAIDWFKNG